MENNINEILSKYTLGEATAEETNKALQEAGSSLTVNKDGRLGNALLDIGVGSMEPVIVADGKLTNAAGVPRQDFVYYRGGVYLLDEDGVTLVES